MTEPLQTILDRREAVIKILERDAQDAHDKLHRLHARIAELEAQLAAIGAGGVSGPLYLGSAPPTAQAEGWRPIETAPKESGYLLLRGGREQDVASGYWLQAAYAGNGAWIWPFVHMTPRFWAHLPPTSAEGVEHG